MEGKPPNPRNPECEVDSMFTDRWSPRAFLSDPLPEHQVKALFEAARWAPSCFNEQPWLFVYATEPEPRQKLVSVLVEKNQRWASRCPLIMFALARRHFQQGGRENLGVAGVAGPPAGPLCPCHGRLQHQESL